MVDFTSTAMYMALILLFVFGVVCVACVYRAWFASRGTTADRKVFDEIVGRRAGEGNEPPVTPKETDSLLGSV